MFSYKHNQGQLALQLCQDERFYVKTRKGPISVVKMAPNLASQTLSVHSEDFPLNMDKKWL